MNGKLFISLFLIVLVGGALSVYMVIEHGKITAPLTEDCGTLANVQALEESKTGPGHVSAGGKFMYVFNPSPINGLCYAHMLSVSANGDRYETIHGMKNRVSYEYSAWCSYTHTDSKTGPVCFENDEKHPITQTAFFGLLHTYLTDTPMRGSNMSY